MQLLSKSLEEEPATAADYYDHDIQFLIEPEPWLWVFLRNIADLFRPAPPPIWITSRPAPYWPDALVNRPVAWGRLRQSFLGHILAVLVIYGGTLLWLSRPQMMQEEVPRTTLTHYELSEYLPAVAQRQRPAPPQRAVPQEADPEYAPQEIVSLHVDHASMQQTIVHPNPALLQRDVPLPNLVAWTAVPSAAPLAPRRQLQNLPLDQPQVVPPPEQMAARSASRLIFPVVPQPEVAAPAGSVAKGRSLPQLPESAPEVAAPAGTVAARNNAPILPLAGPVVVQPSQSIMARDAQRLQIPAQAPEVAAPAASIASRRAISQALPVSAPEVAAPAPGARGRNFSALGLAAQQPPAVPPAEPVISGTGKSQALAVGQLLALNARPAAPVGPVSVPEGNRKGEFAASPEGHPGATARPEIVAGNNASSGARSGNADGPANVYVQPPPARITANVVVAAPAPPPVARTAMPSVPSSDAIDRQIFGGRHNYSIRLSMPNLNSATGSWLMRFAKLHSEPGQEEDIGMPEPIKKVDPAYPASMIQDRIQGTVVLYAIIHADGSVGEVRILEGFDSRLDENARAALEQWRFRPGTKDGVPVDVEAVVRVPFRVPKPAF